MAERRQGTKLCGVNPRRLLVPTEAEQKSGHRLEQQCGGGRRGDRRGEPSVLHGFLYHVFAGEGQDDCASFLLSNMNYLDFQGIFLIHKKLFLSTERRRPLEGECGDSQSSLQVVPEWGVCSNFFLCAE